MAGILSLIKVKNPSHALVSGVPASLIKTEAPRTDRRSQGHTDQLVSALPGNAPAPAPVFFFRTLPACPFGRNTQEGI